MEDACIHIEHFPNQNHHLFAVLDGHGGTPPLNQDQK